MVRINRGYSKFGCLLFSKKIVAAEIDYAVGVEEHALGETLRSVAMIHRDGTQCLE